MFRSILSVFLGFVLMMMLVMTYQMGLWMTTDIFPTPEQIESGDIPTMPIAINMVLLVIDLLIGLFGGYFTVAIAGESRINHAKALAIVVILMSLASLSQSLAVESTWYVTLRFLVVPMCVVLGGRLRCKQSSTPNPESAS